jgi:hypothetical protein
MRLVELDYALRVRVPKPINRLILISNDDIVRISGQQVDQHLFGSVQVLVFINDDMIKCMMIWGRGVVPQVPQCQRH